MTGIRRSLAPLRTEEKGSAGAWATLWHHGTLRFNDYPQSGAARDEVVELQPSFEHLPPLLKPCFPVALRSVLIYDMGGGTFWRFPFDDRGWHLRGEGTAGDAHSGTTEDFRQPDRGCPHAGCQMEEQR